MPQTTPRPALGSLTGLTSHPRCECAHEGPDGPTPCGRPARFSVTIVCAEPGCDSAVAVYLACAPCLRSWQAEAAEDDGLPQMRVRRL